MANDLRLSNLAVNTEADALSPLLDGGKILLYDGAMPTNADTAIGSQNLLATLTFGSPAFGAAVAGLLTANAITDGTGVHAADATWARLTQADDDVVADCTVGTSGCDINLSSVSITVGMTVSISSLTFRVVK